VTSDPSASAPAPDFTKYRPDVDGLRALAVLPVLLFHAKLGCPGGFVGVDVFFVISGYLITGLILKEIQAGTFSLVRFWERRIRRIMPALAVMVFAVLTAAWFLYLPEDFARLGKSAIAQAALVSNVHFYRQGLVGAGYFTPASDDMALLHTWSLAVEEQFYLFFPLLLVLLARFPRLSLTWALLVLAVASCALSIVGTRGFSVATFYLLPTRAWELLLGALLVTMRGQSAPGTLARETAGWFGLGLVVFALCFYDGATPFPGWAIPPCLGAALIIFSSQAKLSFVGRMLAFKPVVFIGLISYSLYLWHWPVLVFARYVVRESQWQGAGFRGALLVVAFALAVLSWRYVETPFRKRLVLQRRAGVFAFAAASTAAMIALGLFIHGGQGVPSRFPAEALRYANSREDHPTWKFPSLQEAHAGEFVGIGATDTNLAVSFLIWGDSHALVASVVLDDLGRQFGRRGMNASQSTTAPVLEYTSTGEYSLKEHSPAYNQAVFDYIARQKVRHVVLAARWALYPASDEFSAKLMETVRRLTAVGAQVYLLKTVPTQDFDVPRLAALTAKYHGDLDQLGVTRERHRLTNAKHYPTFDEVARLGASVLDPADFFLNRHDLYGAVRNGQALYSDDDHLTTEGTKMLAPLFEPIFRAGKGAVP
jgi:peptidoglycan/LPS O-acetylase OafA/YrhL